MNILPPSVENECFKEKHNYYYVVPDSFVVYRNIFYYHIKYIKPAEINS